jgi:repressor of nif and glnA expression
MTSVQEASRTGHGLIGASFREVPAVALPHVQKVIQQMDEAGLGGLVLVGEPSRPLLEIPVDQGRAGIVVAAGLNPIAAVQETGIPTESRAMARLCEFGDLVSLI